VRVMWAPTEDACDAERGHKCTCASAESEPEVGEEEDGEEAPSSVGVHVISSGIAQALDALEW